MKRDLNIYNYGHAVRQLEIAENAVEAPADENQQVFDKHDPNEVFIKLVYSIDSRTKLPTGDLNYLISDKANPEVKDWVLKNIMLDTSAAAVPAAPRGMSDDDIATLARNPKEDINTYMNRINDFARYNVGLMERLSTEYLEKQRDVQLKSEESSVSSE